MTAGLLLSAIPAPPLYAQTPGDNPSVQYRGEEGHFETVVYPLEKINAALRAAGLAEIDPNSPDLPEPGKITIKYEVPAPKERSFSPLNPRQLSAGPLAALAPAPATSAAAVAAPPPLVDLFPSLDFVDNATNTGGSVFIPPDTHGAAGLSHLCKVVNVSFICTTKAGALLPGAPFLSDASGISLASFFAPLTPENFTFDPKILYDHFTDRWVVVTLVRTSTFDVPPAPADLSRILLAVSDDGDPTGTWHYQAIDASEVIGVDSWFDYPGFAVDDDAIYITGNMFTFSTGASTGQRLWIVAKGLGTGGLFDGGVSTATPYDPAGLPGGIAITMQPALIFVEPPPPVPPLPAATEVGTALVAYSGLSGGGIEFLQVIRVLDPVPGPALFSAVEFVALGDIDPVLSALTDAPQLDDGAGPPAAIPIEVNDRRALDAVWRGTSLWVTTTIDPVAPSPDAGQATAHWVELTVPAGTPTTLAQQGSIGGESIAAGTFTSFPSIAVNSLGNVGIGFSASSATTFAGAYFTSRLATDVAGFTEPPLVMAPGLATYVRTFGGPLNRWGDYSGTVVDPDNSIWVFNQRAMLRGTPISGEDGRWEIFCGHFSDLTFPVELVAFDAIADGSSIRLSWETASETNNAGFEIFSKFDSPFLDHVEWRVIDFLAGAGTTLEAQSYSFRVEDLEPGRHVFRLKQLDYDGAFEYSPEVEVFVEIPGAYMLSDAFPNPFNPQAQFTLMLAAPQQVKVEVFDVTGRRVALLHEGLLEADRRYPFTFNAQGLPSGLYFYRVAAERFTDTKSMTLLK